MRFIDLHAQYQSTHQQTIEYFKLPEVALVLNYGPGKWNIKQLLHHIVDAETVMYDRIRRAIAKPNQVVWGFDQDAWAEELDYNHMPIAINLSIYKSIRPAIIHLAEQYYDALGHHKVIHSNTGIRTLAELFQKVAWHNQMHLDQIQKALDS